MSRSGQAVWCEALSVQYGSKTAVDGVSLEVGRGEVFGLLGPNGAGKTSVIRALTTIIEPSAGWAEVAGIPLTSPDQLRHQIGVLPESNGYPTAETAHGYLRFYGQLFGMSGSEATLRASALLERFGLAPHAGAPIGTFSRGMRQRLGISRALINRPQVLFLDEPTLGLDPAGREEVLVLLTSIVETDGTTVVLCSHLLDDVERVCDRVAILDAGRVVSTGTVSAVVDASTSGNVALISVAPDQAESAATWLTRAGWSPNVGGSARPGDFTVDLDQGAAVNGILAVLIGTNIEVREVRLQGKRLSDAFLHLTQNAVSDDG